MARLAGVPVASSVGGDADRCRGSIGAAQADCGTSNLYLGGLELLDRNVLRIPWRWFPVALLTALIVNTIANWPEIVFSWSDRTSAVVGTLVFEINPLIVGTVAFLYVPTLLLERHSVVPAFDRGIELVLLHPWRVLALAVLLRAIQLFGFEVIGYIARTAHMALGPVGLYTVSLVWTIIKISIIACIPAAAYHLLRKEHESATPRALARVFE